ncbi:hypothetical protein [Desulfonatronum thiosulfatophilum]|uniref:hypothetical protein n=1 Tax=Desulfonatronum thiosulfatophilum TaxID=617002 RepID=UPI00111372E1|nr:hypothetical protein [Desulfonatronum thiosulfatophilum]
MFQALEVCVPEQRAAILDVLEPRLGSVHDDLSGKVRALQTPGLERQDKIQGLWLLYLSFVAYPQGDVQIWIGPDLFSDDTGNHLRLILPGKVSAIISTMLEDMRILARVVSPWADVVVKETRPGHVVVILS